MMDLFLMRTDTRVPSSKLRADRDTTSKFKVKGWVAFDRHATWNLEPEI